MDFVGDGQPRPRRSSRDPDKIVLDRKGNRHFSFGIGVHRCIGSNVARTVFKSMLTAVLDRMPDYRCDPEGHRALRDHRRHTGHAQAAGHVHARAAGSAPASTRPSTSCSASATSRNSPGRSPSARKPQSSTEHSLQRHLTWQYRAGRGQTAYIQPTQVSRRRTEGAGREVVDAEHSVDGSRGDAGSGSPRRDAVRKLRSADHHATRATRGYGRSGRASQVTPLTASRTRRSPGPTAKRRRGTPLHIWRTAATR